MSVAIIIGNIYMLVFYNDMSYACPLFELPLFVLISLLLVYYLNDMNPLLLIRTLHFGGVFLVQLKLNWVREHFFSMLLLSPVRNSM